MQGKGNVSIGIDLGTTFAERKLNVNCIRKLSVLLMTALVFSSITKQGKIVRVNLEHWREPEGPVYSKQAIELYQYIQNNIPSDKTIAFEKPRALYLNTQRMSFVPETNNHIAEAADYYLFIKTGNEPVSSPNSTNMLRTEFENDEFIIFSRN